MARWSQTLAQTRLIGGNFRQTLATVPAGGTVYLDPPYITTFDGHTAQGFTEDALYDVCRWAETLRSAAHCWGMLSYRAVPMMTEWFSPDHWQILHTWLTHHVGGPASARRDAQEVIVASRVPNRTMIQLTLPLSIPHACAAA